MDIIFSPCEDDKGEFKTPGRMWESVHNLPEDPAQGSDAGKQTNLIITLFGIDGVGSVGFEDEVIRIGKTEGSWDDLRPRVEAAILACAS